MAKILLLEDDKDLSGLIASQLREQQLDVTVSDNGKQGLQLARSSPFDLLLLDLGLPELDGLDICRNLRQAKPLLPILVLTARNSEIDRVIGLENGADDYMGKPFSIPELLARIRAMLRRQKLMQESRPESAALQFRDLRIDPVKHEVLCRGQQVYLTAREFDLLHFLASHAGRVYNRGQLLDHIWGYTSSNYEHTVNSSINRLRNKIEADSNNPEFVITVRGVGYKFNDALPG